jgi:hypothetical protein
MVWFSSILTRYVLLKLLTEKRGSNNVTFLHEIITGKNSYSNNVEQKRSNNWYKSLQIATIFSIVYKVRQSF